MSNLNIARYINANKTDKQAHTSALSAYQLIASQFTQAYNMAEDYCKVLSAKQSEYDKEISAMMHELERTDYRSLNETEFILSLRQLQTDRRKVEEELASLQSIKDKAKSFLNNIGGA